MKLIYLLVAIVLPGETKPLEQNILTIPVPNMALCKALQSETFITEPDDKFFYATNCVDLSDILDKESF
jgi:hypothetical protein